MNCINKTDDALSETAPLNRSIEEIGDHEELRSIPDATNLVVFVHGLGGDYKKTWGNLPDYICNDGRFINTDIYLFGFKTGFARLFVPPLDALGQRLRTMLLNERTEYKSITLIAHSMGGLVIREAIASILLGGEAEKLNRIEHVVFCSTPHLGSIKATFTFFAGKHVRELRALRPKILDNFKLWLARVNSNSVSPDDIAHEKYSYRLRVTNVWGLYDKTVSKDNASAIPSLTDTVTIEGDHVSMVKPTSNKHNIYKTISKLLVSGNLSSPKLASNKIFDASRRLKNEDLQISTTLQIPEKYESLCERYYIAQLGSGSNSDE